MDEVKGDYFGTLMRRRSLKMGRREGILVHHLHMKKGSYILNHAHAEDYPFFVYLND